MTGRMQTGPEDFLGRVVPALKSVSSSVTQRGKCLPTFQSSVACRDGEGVQSPKRKPSHHQSALGGLSWVRHLYIEEIWASPAVTVPPEC